MFIPAGDRGNSSACEKLVVLVAFRLDEISDRCEKGSIGLGIGDGASCDRGETHNADGDAAYYQRHEYRFRLKYVRRYRASQL